LSDRPAPLPPVSISTAEHYAWGSSCDGWHLVNRPELSVIRERMPPGTSEARHVHSSARQFFYVLSGFAHIEVDGVEIALSVGEGLEIAPGAPHRIFNRADVPLEFLVVSQPHSHGDRTSV
jgi:mannose-6-phosphate isomerase-like protein (cupin superfamily)